MTSIDHTLSQKDTFSDELFERRINCWLEENRIFQVSPEEKKNDFFNKNKEDFKNFRAKSENEFKGFSLKNSILLKRRNTTEG